MVDGLTPEKIKRKYIWLLNALVEDAIVGEDEYGLVWHTCQICVAVTVSRCLKQSFSLT